MLQLWLIVIGSLSKLYSHYLFCFSMKLCEICSCLNNKTQPSDQAAGDRWKRLHSSGGLIARSRLFLWFMICPDFLGRFLCSLMASSMLSLCLMTIGAFLDFTLSLALPFLKRARAFAQKASFRAFGLSSLSPNSILLASQPSDALKDFELLIVWSLRSPTKRSTRVNKNLLP